MLGSREDAEDVLQEVFAAAYNAMLADERPINVRPWLYRIARNRSLNHLRRTQAIGVDSMDIHLSEHGQTTADKVHKREEFRLLMGDVQDLPETQRTALLLREIDALSYDQIAEAMETTVPSVKSLLVRARVSLAEAAEARLLSCEEVRLELGEVAEGLTRTTAPVRRHLRTCEKCQTFRKQLRQTNKALAIVMPVAPLLILKKLVLAHLGTSAAAGGGGAAAAGGGAAAGAAGAAAGGAMQAGISMVATKAAAGIAAAAIVTAGAVEVKHVTQKPRQAPIAVAAAAPVAQAAPAAASAAPVAVESEPQPVAAGRPRRTAPAAAEAAKAAVPDPTASAAPTPAATPAGVQKEGDITELPTEITASTQVAAGALPGGQPAGSQPQPAGTEEPRADDQPQRQEPSSAPPAQEPQQEPSSQPSGDPQPQPDPEPEATPAPEPTPDPEPTPGP
jgi:RNA polymerase sigma factor (sigma-70 family)